MQHSRLLELLETMDVPKLRKNLTLENIRWLKRNLMIRNGEHQHFAEAITIINHMLATTTE